jgi:hypothetical protein
MADYAVEGIRKIKSLTEGNTFRADQIIAKGLRLRENTTVGVNVHRGSGEISIGLVFRHEESKNCATTATVYFYKDVELAQLPAMAISTKVMMEALTHEGPLFGVKDLGARIFAAVIHEFGQVKLEVVADASGRIADPDGIETVQMTIDIEGGFHAFEKRAIYDLKFFLEKI